MAGCLYMIKQLSSDAPSRWNGVVSTTYNNEELDGSLSPVLFSRFPTRNVRCPTVPAWSP